MSCSVLIWIHKINGSLTTVVESEWASAHYQSTYHSSQPKKPKCPTHFLLGHKWRACTRHSDTCFLLSRPWLLSSSLQSIYHWYGCLSWERFPSTCFHLKLEKQSYNLVLEQTVAKSLCHLHDKSKAFLPIGLYLVLNLSNRWKVFLS